MMPSPRFNFDFSDTIEQTYLLISPILSSEASSSLVVSTNGTIGSSGNYIALSKRAHTDLITKFDKELDNERLNYIYKRTMDTCASFEATYERMTGDLSAFAINALNQVVSVHSNVKKLYLQRVKSKRIELFDVRQRWTRLIEQMTHERCMCYDAASAPAFHMLDATESPNRERRRLVRSHLYIAERFFKPDYRQLVANERRQGPLRYLCSSGNAAVAITDADAASVEERKKTFFFQNIKY